MCINNWTHIKAIHDRVANHPIIYVVHCGVRWMFLELNSVYAISLSVCAQCDARFSKFKKWATIHQFHLRILNKPAIWLHFIDQQVSHENLQSTWNGYYQTNEWVGLNVYKSLFTNIYYTYSVLLNKQQSMGETWESWVDAKSEPARSGVEHTLRALR